MSLVTDVLVSLGEHPHDATVVQLAERLGHDPRDIALALSVLEAQGLVLRARDHFGLTRLGWRSMPVAS